MKAAMFESVKTGDCFRHKGETYLKIDSPTNNEAVHLKTSSRKTRPVSSKMTSS